MLCFPLSPIVVTYTKCNDIFLDFLEWVSTCRDEKTWNMITSSCPTSCCLHLSKVRGKRGSGGPSLIAAMGPFSTFHIMFYPKNISSCTSSRSVIISTGLHAMETCLHRWSCRYLGQKFCTLILSIYSGTWLACTLNRGMEEVLG